MATPLTAVQAHGKPHSAEDAVDILYQEGLRLKFVCDDDMRYSITQHAEPQHSHHKSGSDADSSAWVQRLCLASMVRRHLLQQAPVAMPTNEELQEHLQQHSERFATPQRYDFEQRYFRDQQPGTAQIDALNDGVSVKSFPHPVGERFRQLDQAGIQKRFGSAFASAVQGQAVGVWNGPVRSALGWHLMRVNQRHAAQRADFQALRPSLLEHWRRQHREQWLESQIEALAADH